MQGKFKTSVGGCLILELGEVVIVEKFSTNFVVDI